MIAFADNLTGGSWEAMLKPVPPGVRVGIMFSPLGVLHNRGANILFCDGHVLHEANAQTLKQAASKQRRWNNDHEAHAELWKLHYQ